MADLISQLLQGTPFLMDEVEGSNAVAAAIELENNVKRLRSLGQLEPKTLERLRIEWGFQQVHESAAIEGNELSLGETQMAILRGVTISGKPPKHSLEVQNLHEALKSLETMARDDGPLSELEIRQIHSLVLGPSDRNSGKYRDIEVRISNSPHIPPIPAAVPADMETLGRWLAGRPELPVPLIAAIFHAWLVYIHPFADGNGRTARAVTNLLLMRAGFPVVLIRKKDRQRYYETLRCADDGDIGPLLSLVIQRSLDSLRHIDKIRYAAVQMNNAILEVQEAEKRRFKVWQDAIQLLLSNIEQSFLRCEEVDGFEVEFRHYDLPGEEDYVAIQRRDSAANCWLAKVSIRHGAKIRSLLLWMGYASDELLGYAGLREVIPSLKVSAQNSSSYPQWIDPKDDFPSSIREMAYHEGKFFCRRIQNGISTVKAMESDFVLASTFATEVFKGWFS